jgi:hypothetical protein
MDIVDRQDEKIIADSKGNIRVVYRTKHRKIGSSGFPAFTLNTSFPLSFSLH